jgi:hypothetical protein
MICELVSRSVRSLFRRAVVQVWFEGARGLGRRGILPGLAAKMPLRPRPRAQGSLTQKDWKLL